MNISRSLLIAGTILISSVMPSQAEDNHITPSLAISEEYNDNVFETDTHKKSDFITHLMPGISLLYSAPVWDWNVGYNLDYRYYSKNTREDDFDHNLNAIGKITLIDNLLFLAISDTYRRTSLDVTHDTTNESLFVNQTDQNIFSASPYIQLRPSAQTTFKAGYRYVNTWYDSSTAVDKTEHGAFAELGYEVSPYLTVNMGYVFTVLDSSVNDYTKHNSYLGFRYEYSDKSYLFGQAGADYIRYRNGANNANPFWNAGVAHSFDRVAVQANTGVRYTEDPLRESIKETFYTGSMKYLFNRGVVGLNLGYSEYVATDIDKLENRKYSGGVNIKYDLLEDLTGFVGFIAERYDDVVDGDTYTRKYFVDTNLRYQLPKDFSIALIYKYINYYSPDIPSDNYVINRVMLEVRKVF